MTNTRKNRETTWLAVSWRDGVNGTEVSKRHSKSPKDDRRPEHENKGKTQFSMTTENRRKEEQEAKTEELKRNLVQPTNSAMVLRSQANHLQLSNLFLIFLFGHVPT